MRVFQNNIQWKTDQQALQQTIAANKSVAGSFATVADAAKALGLSADQIKHLNAQLGITGDQARASAGAVRDLAGVQREEARAAQDTLRAQQQITQELQKQTPIASRLAQAAAVRGSREQGFVGDLRQDAFGGGGGAPAVSAGSRLQQAAQFGIALPGVGFQHPLVLALRGAGVAAEKTGASFKQVGTAAGLLTLGIVGLSLVIDQAGKSAEDAKQRLSAALAAQERYYDAVASMTTADAAARTEQLQREQELARQRLQEIENAIANEDLTKTTLFGVDIGIETQTIKGAIGDLFGITDELFTNRDEAQQALQTLIDEETRLTQGRAEGVFRANDAREAERELAAERQRATAAAMQAITQAGVGLARDFADAQGMTAADRQAEVASIQRQIAALEEAIDIYYLSGEQVDELNRQIGALQNRQVALTDATSTYADALARTQAQTQQAVAAAGLALDAQRLTTEQRQAEIRALENNIATLQQFVATHDLSSEAVAELAAQWQGMQGEIALLTSTGTTYADKLASEEAHKQALIDKSDAVNDSLEKLRDAEEDVREASDKTADARAALAVTEAEHQRALGRIADEAAAKEIDVRKKTTKRLEDIDAASSERIRQLKENDNLTIEAAIARGDIAAAQQVLREQAVRIEQEGRAREERRREAEADTREQIQQVQDNAARLLAAEQERYNKELAQRQQALNEALDAERAANEAYAAQQREHAFTMQYWANAVAAAQRAVSSATEALARNFQTAASTINSIRLTPVPNSRNMGPSSPGFAGYGTGTYGGSLIGSRAQSQSALRSFYDAYNAWAPAGRSVPTFDGGGISTSPGFYYAGVPEAHIPLSDSRAKDMLGTQMIFAIDARGSSMDETQFRRIVRDEVVPRIEAAKAETVLSLAEVHARIKH